MVFLLVVRKQELGEFWYVEGGKRGVGSTLKSLPDSETGGRQKSGAEDGSARGGVKVLDCILK